MTSRFRLRTLLGAVALVALPLAGLRTRPRPESTPYRGASDVTWFGRPVATRGWIDVPGPGRAWLVVGKPWGGTWEVVSTAPPRDLTLHRVSISGPVTFGEARARADVEGEP